MSAGERMDVDGIAVVGMAGRFPGAPSVDALWAALAEGRELLTRFAPGELDPNVDPRAAADPAYVPVRGMLAGAEDFDAAFFGMTPGEAALTAPEYRLFLECCSDALERAGQVPGAGRSRVAVFGGAGFNTYLLRNLAPRPGLLEGAAGFQAIIANDKDQLAARVAYRLDLRGPAVTVQTACSTSLVAVHLACQSLLAGECDVALAGGATVGVPQASGYVHAEGGILAPDGHCRAFDAEARGTVPASGAAVVALRRLEDALRDGDTITAVIRGTAINSDGAGKVGYTAPGVDGQAAVIAEALAVADVDPATIGYVEAHGTGTPMGDPIEVAALTRAYRARTSARGFCALGSIKSNLGHLDAAAGVTGLIKAALALRHGVVPPTLHFRAPNPRIDFAGSPFFVAAGEAAPWPLPGTRRAGVSSFGVGGTNAHAVLEEPPEAESAPTRRAAQLLVVSARTEAALAAARANLAAHLRDDPDASLADAAFTLSAGRRTFAHRAAVVARTAEEAAEALGSARGRLAPDEAPPVVFLFPGQGAQHPGMGRALYETEPAYRDALDRCADTLLPHLGLDLRALLHPAPGADDDAAARLRDTAVAQPAIFAVEYALAALWPSWGIRPAALAGHSIGEYVAACLAGVFTLEDALRLVAARGRLMGALPAGAMLSVPLPAGELALDAGLSLAAVNAPRSCVVSGPEAAVEAFAARLEDGGVKARRLHTSHAFHSAMMDPALEAFRAEVARVPRAAPRVPFASNLTGGWITPEEACDPDYWTRHLRGTVRFSDNLRLLLATPGTAFVEAGPGRTLTTLVADHDDGATAVATLRHPREDTSDAETALRALGGLWAAGVPVDWRAFWKGERRRRIPLPTYPFERKRHWIDAPPPAAAPSAVPAAAPAGEAPDADEGVMERVIARQLEVMAAQIEAIRSATADDGVGAAEPAGASHPAPASSGDAADGVPLLPIQRWFFATRPADPHHFNHARLLVTREALDEEALRRTMDALAERHQALRLRFRRRGADWRAVAGGAAGAVAVERVDLASEPPQLHARTISRVAAAAQERLNLADGPLARAVAFDLGRGRPGRLLLVVHHLAVDLTSWAVLLGELEAIHEANAVGRPHSLPPVATPYAAWAEGLDALARSGALDGELPLWSAPPRRAARPLPRDLAGRGAGRERDGRALDRWLEPRDTEALLARAPREFGVQVNDVLLAGLAAALTPWAGGAVAVDVEGHGREDAVPGLDPARTVGWLTAPFPVLLEDGGEADAHGAVRAVRDQLRGIPRGGLGWGLLRHLARSPALDAVPAAEAVFSWLGRPALAEAAEGLLRGDAPEETGPAVSPLNPRPYLLEVQCGVDGGRLRMRWRYAATVHRPETVAALADAFAARLAALLGHAAGRDARIAIPRLVIAGPPPPQR